MFDYLLLHKEKYNNLYANFQFKNKSNMAQKHFNLSPTLDQRFLELSVTNSIYKFLEYMLTGGKFDRKDNMIGK
jgi:hypothetical protein